MFSSGSRSSEGDAQLSVTRQLSGGCLCGAVRYRVEDAFVYSANCDCSACRRATGAAFRSFAEIARQKLEVVAGADRLWVLGTDQANHTRCQDCGTYVFAVVREGSFVRVNMGTLDQTPSIRPTEHIFVGSKAGWHTISDALPQFTGHAIEAPSLDWNLEPTSPRR